MNGDSQLAHLSDAELVERVKALKDQAAFAKLYERHSRQVLRILRRFFRDDPNVVEDVAQETFLKAYRFIGGFRSNSLFSTWIYRIAINAAKDYRQKTAFGDTHISLDEVEEKVRTEAMRLPRQLIKRDKTLEHLPEWEIFHAAFDGLTQKDAALITLFDLKGYSHEEIATLLGRKNACSSKNLHGRAMKALREIVATL